MSRIKLRTTKQIAVSIYCSWMFDYCYYFVEHLSICWQYFIFYMVIRSSVYWNTESSSSVWWTIKISASISMNCLNCVSHKCNKSNIQWPTSRLPNRLNFINWKALIRCWRVTGAYAITQTFMKYSQLQNIICVPKIAKHFDATEEKRRGRRRNG